MHGDRTGFVHSPMLARKSILAIGGLGIIFSLWLVYNEVVYGETCPPYPFIGIPACYLVLIFFILIVLSQHIPKYERPLFLSGALLGLLTAIWFSISQVLGVVECPKLLGIPLCFVAGLTFFTLIFIDSLASGQKRMFEENEKR